ncbi:MAG TPA: hypothetical protein VMB81_05845 [Candidatus Sulfotelmatobacter sp.]|nr:hypothetical protein [Candidatus Sulfotelmatobacter sp.]
MAKRPQSPGATHENLDRSDDVRVGSDRVFGLVIAAALCLISAVRLWRGTSIVYPAIGAAAFAVLAILVPRALRPLNILWFRFGLLLHAIVTPIVLGLMFYTTITPLGWLMRAFGKRPLALEFDQNAASYWIHRTPPGPSPDSLSNQF